MIGAALTRFFLWVRRVLSETSLSHALQLDEFLWKSVKFTRLWAGPKEASKSDASDWLIFSLILYTFINTLRYSEAGLQRTQQVFSDPVLF